ncbi:hypothetical protein RHGRI_019226 [Rhododendron griersonianum]|uniref:2'-phosphotransferase n=1 Tax=Rhododendron griersonianum TaxID=479676 RepID=A0AAV6JBS7_9ERIC|nr:hypothetical protein RHGRI_019226 [Rhododendron griersonianum]
MWASATCGGLQFMRYCLVYPPPVPFGAASSPSSLLTRFRALAIMDNVANKFRAPSLRDNTTNRSSSSSAFAHSGRSGGRERGLDERDNRERSRGRGGGRGGRSSGKDKIDALGRLMTRILRHMASELSLSMRSDGYVRVQDVLKLNMKTFADIPLRAHTIDDVREAVRRDNKQRFSLLEENGELLIRANQGHSITVTYPLDTERLKLNILCVFFVAFSLLGCHLPSLTVETESLLKPILSAEEIPGIRYNINVLIFLDVRKALEEGMKLYISDNKVILTEGFDGVVPVKYFEKIESWPDRRPIPF